MSIQPLYPFAKPPPKGWRPAVLAKPEGVLDYETGLWELRHRVSQELLPGIVVHYEPGLTSDGASIPWFVQSAFSPRYDAYTFSQAFNHDIGYAARIFPRVVLDVIFRVQLYMATPSKMTTVKAEAYSSAVMLCGWYPWIKHTPESVAAARALIRVEQVETV